MVLVDNNRIQILSFLMYFPKTIGQLYRTKLCIKSRGLLGLIASQVSQLQGHIFTPLKKKDTFSVHFIGVTSTLNTYKVMAAAQFLLEKFFQQLASQGSEQVTENKDVAF